VLHQDFESAVDASKAVFSIILDTDNKQISTESLLHIAAALNISVSGDCNLHFKVRSAIGKHAKALNSAQQMSTSVHQHPSQIFSSLLRVIVGLFFCPLLCTALHSSSRNCNK
jgi:hypothetical protein